MLRFRDRGGGGVIRLVFLTAIVASLLNSTTATAQFGRASPLISVRDRVRVGVRNDTSRSSFTGSAQYIRGTVQAIAPDTLYLDLPSGVGTFAIPRVAIRGVELSTGTPSRAVSALDFGSAGGFLGGLFLPSFMARPEHRFGSRGGAVAASAGIGFAVGALVGGLFPRERWRVAWIPE